MGTTDLNEPRPASSEAGDRAAIEALISDYCYFCDVNDPASIGGLFTEDCAYDHGPGAVMRGAAEVAATIGANHETIAQCSHHATNVRIEFETPDLARGRVFMIVWHRWHNADRPNWTAYGHCEDLYARTPDGWRIAERKVIMHGQEGEVASIAHMHTLPRGG